jgi:hypothetical protein
MDYFTSRELTGRKLGRLEARKEVAGLTIGHGNIASVLVLPLEQFGETVLEFYGEAAYVAAERINTGPTERGLRDRALQDIAVNQMDAEGDIRAGTLYILTLWGGDCAAMVPANAYWRARVEGEQ